MNSWIVHGNLLQYKQAFQSMVKAYPSPSRVFSTPTPRDIRLLLITRKIATSGTTNEILARAFANLPEIVSSLRKLIKGKHLHDSVTLIVADFADIPFVEQVRVLKLRSLLFLYHLNIVSHSRDLF